MKMKDIVSKVESSGIVAIILLVLAGIVIGIAMVFLLTYLMMISWNTAFGEHLWKATFTESFAMLAFAMLVSLFYKR